MKLWQWKQEESLERDRCKKGNFLTIRSHLETKHFQETFTGSMIRIRVLNPSFVEMHHKVDISCEMLYLVA